MGMEQMSKIFKKKYVQIILVVVILAAILTPSSLLFLEKHKANQETEVSNVQTSFVAQNPQTTLSNLVTQDKIYIAAWEDSENQGISALIGGVWIKVYSEKKQSTTTTTPTTTQTTNSGE